MTPSPDPMRKRHVNADLECYAWDNSLPRKHNHRHKHQKQNHEH